jgi:serine/threonine protein kinase
MIGKQIHKFEITKEIGSGGMGTVYEAVHTRLENKVAIKVLDPVLSAVDDIRERFEQEAKIMASLTHGAITKVIDFDEEGSQLAIIMEFLDGETLDEYIRRNGSLKEDEAKRIFSSVLDAFEYAHNKGVVHRDVKPANIFITKNGDVKIMDFGIAKLMEDGAKMLTQTGTQMGTPVYMSPEQVNDAKNIDLRTDVYSLGATIWFALNGNPPYDATVDSTFAIYKKIDAEPLDELSNVSAEMNAVIQKATAKKPEDRYSNCAELKKDLIDKASEKTVVIPPISSEEKETAPSDKTVIETGGADKTQIETPKEEPKKEDSKTVIVPPVEGVKAKAKSTTAESKQPVQEKPEEEKTSKKKLFFIIGGVAAIVLIVVLVMTFTGGEPDYGDEYYSEEQVDEEVSLKSLLDEGNTFLKSGDTDAAREVFQRAHELYPEEHFLELLLNEIENPDSLGVDIEYIFELENLYEQSKIEKPSGQESSPKKERTPESNNEGESDSGGWDEGWESTEEDKQNIGLSVGDEYGGGYIIYIDDSGHGVICAKSALGENSWDGAVSVASSYAGGGYSDWYLPSGSELNHFADMPYSIKLQVIDDGFVVRNVWTSDEWDYKKAWVHDTYKSTSFKSRKKQYWKVIPVRRF